MQNHDAPDELDDVEAHPSLLTFINKDPQPSLTAKTSSTALNKRGSKRANALVGNVTNKRALLSQVGQKSSRVLVPASRSLSLPGYDRNSTLLSTTQQQSDEIASNRSIGAASDSGQKGHRVSNAFENKSLRCESTVNPVQHSQTIVKDNVLSTSQISEAKILIIPIVLNLVPGTFHRPVIQPTRAISRTISYIPSTPIVQVWHTTNAVV
jgi:hypothetical protein